MASAFTGCTTDHTKGGCPFNANCGTGGCPKQVCCRQKDACQIQINEYLDEIKAYRLKLRILKDEYKRRPTSKCDKNTPLSKVAFEKKRDELQHKIDKRVNAVCNLKKSKKAKLLVRDPDARCANVTGKTPVCVCAN